MTVVMSQPQDEPLYKDYQRLLEQGTKPNLAKVTLARKIAATALAMWKRQGGVRPDPLSQAVAHARTSGRSAGTARAEHAGAWFRGEQGSRESIHIRLGLRRES